MNKDALNRRFHLEERKTTVSTEILAGLTTFATMSYILAVQPSMMADAGMNALGVFAATAIVAALVTIAMGLISNAPLALAPGMGDNALVAYTLVGLGLATWQTCMGMMVFTGSVFLVLSCFKIREKLANYLPKSIKLGMSATLGIFLFQIGMSNTGLLVDGGWGDFSDPNIVLTMIGLIIAIVLNFIRFDVNGKEYKLRGSMLVSILLTTIIGAFMGLVHVDFNIGLKDTFTSLGDVAFKADVLGIFKAKYIPYIVIFLVGDFTSTLGTAMGAGNKAGLMDKDGNMPMLGKIFLVDAAGTVIGASMGVTVVTSYAESAAGVEAGGRTGLTSIVTGVLFIISLVFAPLFVAIPSAATGPVLLMIGVSCMQELRTLDFDTINWTPVAFMIGFTAFSGMAIGVTVGLFTDIIVRVCSFAFKKDRTREDLPSWPTVILAALMSLQFIL